MMGMPTVFIIARDWTLRAGARAELREQGIHALGMDSPDQAGQALAAGELPAALVIEAIPEITGDPAVGRLIERVPTILIASRTQTAPLPADRVLYRPVRIGEIIRSVQELLERGHAA
jgi:DNA-binding response OmpR family regulator